MSDSLERSRRLMLLEKIRQINRDRQKLSGTGPFLVGAIVVGFVLAVLGWMGTFDRAKALWVDYRLGKNADRLRSDFKEYNECHDRPTTLVVPFGLSGPTGELAIKLTEHLNRMLPHRFEAKYIKSLDGGADTNDWSMHAAEFVSRQNDNPCYLLIHHNGLLYGIHQYQEKERRVTSSRFLGGGALAWVGLLNNTPMILVGRKDLQYENYWALMRDFKLAPSDFRAAHVGISSLSHLCLREAFRNAGWPQTFLPSPYETTADALRDLETQAKKIDFMCDQTTNPRLSVTLEKGKIKGLMMYANTIPADYIGVPPSAISINSFHGIYAPPRANPRALQLINDAIQYHIGSMTRGDRKGVTPVDPSLRSRTGHQEWDINVHKQYAELFDECYPAGQFILYGDKPKSDGHQCPSGRPRR